MIYPGTHNITILQDSTWQSQFRVGTDAKSVAINVEDSIFTSTCHGFVPGDVVYFSPATATSRLPCGMTPDDTFYVIADGLSDNTFKVSETAGGPAYVTHGTTSGKFLVAKPLDLTGYTVDSDIKLPDDTQLATFTVTMVDEPNGKFVLSMDPATSLPLTPGSYSYDVSLTSSTGERYYWITGTATVKKTYSRV